MSFRKGYKFFRREHINLLETQVLRILVKLSSGDPEQWSSRRPVGIDSRVAKGATCKGRSPSFRLNCILRQTLPFELGADLYFSGWFIPSGANPADDGTRTRATREGGQATERMRGVFSGDPRSGVRGAKGS